MGTVKLNTTKDLERFLRILAEESVFAAQTAQATPPKPQEKQRQKSIAKGIRKGIADLSEDDPAAPGEEAPAADAAPTAPPAETPKPTAPTPKDASAADINPTISSVIDAIKDIRGGKGASDSAIETELIAYFDRLEEAEKTALVVMLRSLGAILRQQQSGAEAPEPADYQIFTSMKPSEDKAKPAAPAPSAPAEAGTTPAEEEEPAGEDTAPPIKVGAPVSEAYRAKIRYLLSKNR